MRAKGQRRRSKCASTTVRPFPSKASIDTPWETTENSLQMQIHEDGIPKKKHMWPEVVATTFMAPGLTFSKKNYHSSG